MAIKKRPVHPQKPNPVSASKRNRFPAGWYEARVERVLRHYDSQTDEEAVAEDEAAFRKRGRTVMVVPRKLVPAITKLIERQGR